MTENSPLQKYYRQPAIYLKLPSGGKYYSPEVFTPTETGEVPVLPMTVKDELAFKTPDALLNGQSTVDVIKSCIPNIKDPWQMINYDTDAVLLAIRIATYGETMTISYNVPITGEKQDGALNLPALLEELGKIEIKDKIKTTSGFELEVEPLTYKNLTKLQIANFEQQKIVGALQSSALTEQDKSTAFQKSFDIINKVNFSLMLDSIKQITTPDGVTVDNRQHILDFCNNADSKIDNEIEDNLSEIRVQAQVPPMRVKATDEQIKSGVPTTFNVPVTFDNSNFFG